MSDGDCRSGIDSGEPELTDGADPWCTWCDDDLPETVWMLDGEDEGRWPPAFCSEECAEAWGNATHEGKGYRAARGDVVAE